jgi:phosphoglycolate phosphatase-like HAD superfamily hydrolase/ADP-ribose pyrophosphatase YjhB (NUDIX family)
VIRNIIFDWSGTLVDDLPAVWRATNHVFSRAGIGELTLDQFRREFCLPFARFYDRHLPHVPMNQLEEWFHGHFREAQDSVVELPFARDFLEFCRARQLRTFLLTTMHPDHFGVQAQRNGFDQFIDRPYLGVWDKRQKIEEILAENGLTPAETLFIGDMQHDVETAKVGGIHSCAVLTGYNTLGQLRESQPDLIVEHLAELRVILENNRMEIHPAAGAPPALPIATVGALIADRAGNVLMVRTRKWSNLWGIPGGKIKWGESTLAALRREVREETNLEIDNVQFVFVQDCIRSPEFYREAHFLLLNYTAVCREPVDVRLNHEAHEFRWVTIDEALAMELNTPTRRLLDAAAQGQSSEKT